MNKMDTIPKGLYPFFCVSSVKCRKQRLSGILSVKCGVLQRFFVYKAEKGKICVKSRVFRGKGY